MLVNFKIKTTVEFDVDILVDGTAPELTVLDIVTFIMKEHIDDSDDDAIITKIGTNMEIDGKVHFLLTPTDTDIEPRKYYIELKWDSNGAVNILDSSTVHVLKRVFD